MQKVTTKYAEMSASSFGDGELILAIPQTIKTRIQLNVAKSGTPSEALAIKVYGSADGTEFITTPLVTIDHAHTDEDAIYSSSVDTQDIVYLKIECKSTDANGYGITPTITNVVL